jgi:hypothetical protein
VQRWGSSSAVGSKLKTGTPVTSHHSGNGEQERKEVVGQESKEVRENEKRKE